MRIKILKDNIVTNTAIFSTQEEVDSWLDYHRSMNSFGQERQVIVTPEVVIQHEAVPATEESLEIEAYEEIIPESTTIIEGFTVICDDESMEISQEEINAEALQYLADTDWYVLRRSENNTPVPEQILTERAAARSRIVR